MNRCSEPGASNIGIVVSFILRSKAHTRIFLILPYKEGVCPTCYFPGLVAGMWAMNTSSATLNSPAWGPPFTMSPTGVTLSRS